MISLPLASAVFTLLLISIGVIHWKLEQRIRQIRKLEDNLANARRELQSLEMLKTRFLGRIGDVLAEPLKAIEASSDRFARENPGLPDSVLKDLSRLSGEVHSLVRILTVFEQISRSETNQETPHPVSSQRVRLDSIVSEAAMEISDAAADRLVSVSVSICGRVEVSGNSSQIAEAVLSLLNQTLKRSGENTVLSLELRESDNIELEIIWTGEHQPDAGDENLLGTGLSRLIASSHGGWVSEDLNEGRVTLILPKPGDGK